MIHPLADDCRGKKRVSGSRSSSSSVGGTHLQEQVLGLEVAVRHLHLVQVLDAVDDLVEEAGSLEGGE
jgi:hypothetical protein